VLVDITPSSLSPGGSIKNSRRQWFCIRAKPKHEHIAAAHIRLCPETEVFFPRIRFKRRLRKSKIWVVEPLFPNYLFARFDLRDLAQVRYSAGVHNIVHFGIQIPIIPDAVIAELKADLDAQCVGEVNPTFTVGDSVKIIEGAFNGFKALVTRVIPARERVAVLLDFLGRQVTVEIETNALLKDKSPREIWSERREGISSDQE
jgi:transcriptional antiterminator RfaH